MKTWIIIYFDELSENKVRFIEKIYTNLNEKDLKVLYESRFGFYVSEILEINFYSELY